MCHVLRDAETKAKVVLLSGLGPLNTEPVHRPSRRLVDGHHQLHKVAGIKPSSLAWRGEELPSCSGQLLALTKGRGDVAKDDIQSKFRAASKKRLITSD